MSNKETDLMKKTKAQLVEIIFRKDNEEICLKETIKSNEETIAKQDDAINEVLKSIKAVKKDTEEKDNTIKRLTDSLNKANANVVQHQAAIDELTSQKVEAENAAKCLKNERDSARNWNYVLGIAVIIIAACWIIF